MVCCGELANAKDQGCNHMFMRNGPKLMREISGPRKRGVEEGLVGSGGCQPASQKVGHRTSERLVFIYIEHRLRLELTILGGMPWNPYWSPQPVGPS